MTEFNSKTFLLERVRQGDSSALGELLEDLRPYVRVILHCLRRGQCSSVSDESDLIQDVLLQASQSVGTFHGVTMGEWLGWLRTITVRTAHRSRMPVNQITIRASSDVDLATLIVDKDADPHADAVRHENAARMATVLAQLPDEMQQVLLGRLGEDLEHAELAARLGRSTANVRMLYLRAVRRLREVWQAEFTSITGDVA